MQCPKCGILTPADQQFCRACGVSLPEFTELLAEKIPTERGDRRLHRRKTEKWRLRIWTCAGAVFYLALYWIIISEIVIRKGHVLRGILFLVAITAISFGGLLILYKAALGKRSKHREKDQPKKGDPSPDLVADPAAELRTSISEPTSELPENEDSKEEERGSMRTS
jgi:hypothetical protein